MMTAEVGIYRWIWPDGFFGTWRGKRWLCFLRGRHRWINHIDEHGCYMTWCKECGTPR